MAELLIAIVGSTNLKRPDYEPSLTNGEQAKVAAVELGREFAKAKHRILVYTSDPGYIEADVVRGYVESGVANTESILLRYPAIAGPIPHFPEQDKDNYGRCFKEDPDDSPNWQVCFFSSLQQADAILLLGGASSALISYLIAEMSGIALLPIATFGGAAQTVWGLASRRFDEKVRRITGAPRWRADSAAQLVDALASEHARIVTEKKARQEGALGKQQALAAQRRARRLAKQAVLSGFLMLAAVALTLLGTFSPPTKPIYFGIFFLLTPLLAGATGGLGRNLLDFYRKEEEQPGHTPIVAIVLGAIAGTVAAILFVSAQWASNPEIRNLDQAIPPGLRLLVLFEFVIGLLSGFTLDALFRQWEKERPKLGSQSE
jgi:hypothetical protein